MKIYNLTAIIWKEGKFFVSRCPELEVASMGKSPEEALKNLKDAVELYLENAKILGIMKDLQKTLNAPHKFTANLTIKVS